MACSAGGTVRVGIIEVQGDHCDRIFAVLRAEAIASNVPVSEVLAPVHRR